MPKLYIVNLTDDERQQLLDLVKKGRASARQLNRAHILLQAHDGATDAAIAAALHVGRATVERIRKRFVEGNLERALNEDHRAGPAPCQSDRPAHQAGLRSVHERLGRRTLPGGQSRSSRARPVEHAYASSLV